jgi:hypothetical protein
VKETDVAYIAGIIDSEGCIRIKRDRGYACQDRKTPGYHAALQIRMVDEGAIRFIAETLGGWYFKEKPSAAKGRPLYCWTVSDKNAEHILRTVLPYLRVKRLAAETALALRDLQAECGKHRTKIIGYRNFPNSHGTPRQVANKCFSDEYVQMCEDLYLRCREHNRVGVR